MYKLAALLLAFSLSATTLSQAQPLNIISPAISGGTQTSPIITTPTITGGLLTGDGTNTTPGVSNIINAPSIFAPIINGGTATGTTIDSAVSGGLPISTDLAHRQHRVIATPGNFLASGQTLDQYLTGSVDIQPLVTTALAAGSVTMPCGTYLFNTAAAIPLLHSFVGANAECVKIQFGSSAGDPTTGDIFQAVNVSHVRFGNFQILTNATRSKGAVLHASATNDLMVQDLQAFGQYTTSYTFYDILRLDAGSEFTQINRTFLTGSTHDCIGLYGYVIDTHIDNYTTSACGTALHIRSASGVYGHTADMGGSLGNAVLIDPSTNYGDNGRLGTSSTVDTQGVNGVFLTSFFADTSVTTGWQVQCYDNNPAGTKCGLVSEVSLVTPWAAGSGGPLLTPYPGFLLNNPNIDVFKIDNAIVRYNGGHGIDLEYGNNITVSDSHVMMNGRAASGTYNGIIISGTPCQVNIIGNDSGAGGYDGHQVAPEGTNYQYYGLYHGTGSCPIHAIGNWFKGNLASTQFLLQSGDVNLGNN